MVGATLHTGFESGRICLSVTGCKKHSNIPETCRSDGAYLAALGLLVVEQQAVGGIVQDAAANQEHQRRDSRQTDGHAPSPRMVLSHCAHANTG